MKNEKQNKRNKNMLAINKTKIEKCKTRRQNRKIRYKYKKWTLKKNERPKILTKK